MDEKFNNMDEDNQNDSKEMGVNSSENKDINNFNNIFEDDKVIKPDTNVRKVPAKKKKKKKRSIASTIIVITIILAISVILSTAIIVFSSDVLGLSGSEDIVTLDIPKGTTITKVAEILKDKKL